MTHSRGVETIDVGAASPHDSPASDASGPRRFGAWIDGMAVPAASGEWLPVTNPFTGDVFAEVAKAGASEAVRAVDAAGAALADWSSRTANDRANVLQRAYRNVREHREELAQLLVEECGKLVAEAQKEVRDAGAFVRAAAEEARRLGGDTLPAPRRDQRIIVQRRPVGVVAALTPANGPANTFGRKAAFALAAGCTVVLKPAEETPVSSLVLARLFHEAGVPAGAINVIAGDAASIAEVLVEHRSVALITFTGSVARGRALYAAAAANMKQVVLELGGVAPFVVFSDADVDLALDGLLAAKFRMAGQICASPQRLLVQTEIFENFRSSLLDRLRQVRFGDPRDPANQYGPLYHERILLGVENIVADAVDKGARVLLGGESAGGLLYPPTVLCDVDRTMAIRCEEAFGPLVTLEAFTTADEAIALANDTEYGLGAYIYSTSLSQAWTVAEALEAGVVGVNDPFPVTVEGPFGGIKGSGLGREGGAFGLDEFLVTKQLTFTL